MNHVVCNVTSRGKVQFSGALLSELVLASVPLFQATGQLQLNGLTRHLVRSGLGYEESLATETGQYLCFVTA